MSGQGIKPEQNIGNITFVNTTDLKQRKKVKRVPQNKTQVSPHIFEVVLNHSGALH